MHSEGKRKTINQHNVHYSNCTYCSTNSDSANSRQTYLTVPDIKYAVVYRPSHEARSGDGRWAMAMAMSWGPRRGGPAPARRRWRLPCYVLIRTNILDTPLITRSRIRAELFLREQEILPLPKANVRGRVICINDLQWRLHLPMDCFIVDDNSRYEMLLISRNHAGKCFLF